MSETGLTYDQFAVPAALAGDVRCIWRLSGSAPPAAGAEPIVPDGCAEIVLNFADPFIHHPGSHPAYAQPLSLCAGQLTTAIRIRPPERVDIWGIRFQPWSAARLLDAHAGELRDQLPALDSVSGGMSAALAHIGDVVPDHRYAAIVDAIGQRMSKVRPAAPMLRSAVRYVMAQREPMTVRMLAERTGVSVRRLQTQFAEQVGMPPKLLMRIARFQHALAIARDNPSLAWARVAQQAGYHDQAHLIHDSHDLAGVTPGDLAARETGLTETFLEG